MSATHHHQSAPVTMRQPSTGLTTRDITIKPTPTWYINYISFTNYQAYLGPRSSISYLLYSVYIRAMSWPDFNWCDESRDRVGDPVRGHCVLLGVSTTQAFLVRCPGISWETGHWYLFFTSEKTLGEPSMTYLSTSATAFSKWIQIARQ